MSDNSFDLEVIARGTYVDTPYGENEKFLVETFTLRLNWVALNAWHNAHTSNCRDCYIDGAEGDKEWNDRQEEVRIAMGEWRDKVCAAIGKENLDSVVITQSTAEVFAVVQISKVNPA